MNQDQAAEIISRELHVSINGRSYASKVHQAMHAAYEKHKYEHLSSMFGESAQFAREQWVLSILKQIDGCESKPVTDRGDWIDAVLKSCRGMSMKQVRAIPQLVAWFRSCADGRDAELMKIFARKGES